MICDWRLPVCNFRLAIADRSSPSFKPSSAVAREGLKLCGKNQTARRKSQNASLKSQMLLGDYRIEIVPDTEFRLDGGAMFGVVPRVLWEKRCPPDELNRIRLNMNCLFIETPKEKILIETGIGEKWTEKQTEMYGIFREKPFAQTLFEKTGCRPEDITLVVNTHLHFDHAGGNTIFEGNEKLKIKNAKLEDRRQKTEDEKRKTGDRRRGEEETKAQKTKPKNQSPKTKALTPQFPNARYLVSRSEYEQAENPSERDRASYLAENWRPLLESGRLELMPDYYEVVEGLSMEQVRGHSATMQTVCLRRGGRTLYGFADLVPTRAHVPFPWIMGYDLYPVETLEAKKRLIPQAARENWLCLFYHDPETPLCRIIEEDGKFKTVPAG
jgi:glyoxylase-like metal-dependent hydrolase (beta-lactamase superfamily II)